MSSNIIHGGIYHTFQDDQNFEMEIICERLNVWTEHRDDRGRWTEINLDLEAATEMRDAMSEFIEIMTEETKNNV